MSPNALLKPGTAGVDKGPADSHLLGPLTESQQQPPKVGPMRTLNPVQVDCLEAPPVVRGMLARLATLSPAERLDYEREFKLSFYYEGQCVAVRETATGPEVVAFGPDQDVLAIVRSLSATEAEHITIVDPTPLAAIASQLPRAAARQVG